MWRFLERSIASVAPTWARNRAVARSQLDVINSVGGSGGGQRISDGINDQASRVAANREVGTVDEDVERNRLDDLKVARLLMAKNSFAIGAVKSITGNVIGRGMNPESGIMFQPRAAANGEPNTALNALVEARFKKWARTASLCGKKSFRSQQRQVYSERWIAGEVFVRRHIVTGREIPLALEVVPGELLADLTEGKIKQGVELDSNNAPVAYHFLKSEGSVDEPERVEAAEVVHLFKPHRAGAVRGMSPLAPVSDNFEALRQYLNHELTRAAISSAFVAMFKSGTGNIRGLGTSNATDRTDSSGNPLISVLDGGGMLLRGGPNDSLESVAPAIQSTAFDPFVRLILRSIATGLGVSYELIARDFTQTNYSSARQSSLEDRRQWEPEQEEFTDELLLTIWDWFIDAASNIARVRPFTAPRAVWPVTWTPQGWLWVDPDKDAKGLLKSIQIGTDNPIDAARRLGTDYYENVRKIAAAQAYAREQNAEMGEPQKETPDVDVEDKEKEDPPAGASKSGDDGAAKAA